MIPSAYRKSTDHRKLYATMQFLVEHEKIGPIAKSGQHSRLMQFAAMERHRSLLEAKAADLMGDYFREESLHVINAAQNGSMKLSKNGEGDPVLVFKGGDPFDAMAVELTDIYVGAMKDAMLTWADWVERRSPFVAKASTEARIDQWLKVNAGKKITGITESSRKKITAEIARGVKAGEGNAAIGRRLSKFYLEDIIPNRAMVIAQTEIGAATNFIQYELAKDSGVHMEKEWMSLRDARVREDHAEANGQRQPMDEPFNVGDASLMFPCDPDGPPEETIRCRCSVLYHVLDGPARKTARPPSPAEFAKDVLGIENDDVAVSLAYMKGVFGEKDEWTKARKMLMKHVHRLRRSKS